MPFIDIHTSAPTPSPAVQTALLADISRQASQILGKPESVMMVRLSASGTMRFAASAEPCCFIDVRSIGLPTDEARAAVTSGFTELVAAGLKLPESRVFVVFAAVAGSSWGVGGQLLA